VKTLAVQRSLKHMKANGWTVCVVEKFIAAIKQRKDAFGFGDLLACRPAIIGHYPNPSYSSAVIALVQCCPGASHAEHKDKILSLPEFKTWKEAGGKVFLQSWSKKGPRGKRKQWALREEVL
jgi:hypothetical protein